MTIVVDTSVLISVLTNEPERRRMIERTQGAELIAPASVHWEVGNALSAMLKRKRLTPRQAAMVLHAYHRIPIRFVDVDLDAALKIALDQGLYADDAYLIECALNNRCPVLSLDGRLRQAAVRAGAQVMEGDP